jgi:hypothetical protein
MCFNGVLMVYIDSAKTSFINIGFSCFLPAHRETPKMHKERPPLISLVYLESTLQHFKKSYLSKTEVPVLWAFCFL